MSQARFQKRQREKARQEKAAAKRERRTARAEATAAEADAPESAVAPPETDVLAELAELHRKFGDDEIGFEEFENRKLELLAQIDV